MIFNKVKFKFHVGYMKFPMLKEHVIRRDQVTKSLSEFHQTKVKCINIFQLKM